MAAGVFLRLLFHCVPEIKLAASLFLPHIHIRTLYLSVYEEVSGETCMCADEVWSSGLKPHVLVNEKREFDAAAGRVFTESPLPRGAQLATNEQKAVKTCISLGEKWLRMKRIKMKFKKKKYMEQRGKIWIFSGWGTSTSYTHRALGHLKEEEKSVSGMFFCFEGKREKPVV